MATEREPQPADDSNRPAAFGIDFEPGELAHLEGAVRASFDGKGNDVPTEEIVFARNPAQARDILDGTSNTAFVPNASKEYTDEWSTAVFKDPDGPPETLDSESSAEESSQVLDSPILDDRSYGQAKGWLHGQGTVWTPKVEEPRIQSVENDETHTVGRGFFGSDGGMADTTDDELLEDADTLDA